jgi:hypothetical protein
LQFRAPGFFDLWQPMYPIREISFEHSAYYGLLGCKHKSRAIKLERHIIYYLAIFENKALRIMQKLGHFRMIVNLSGLV